MNGLSIRRKKSSSSACCLADGSGGGPCSCADASAPGGGQTAGGLTASAARTNLAPQPPFFQLGLLGATVPGLKLDGEIGQQIGYLNAAGVGTVNFILLIVIGWAFAHRERVREMVAAYRRRRAQRGEGQG